MPQSTRRALCGLALLAPLLGVAGAAEPRIEVTPAHPAVGEPFAVSISGRQSHSCVPMLDSVQAGTDDLVILARRSTDHCLKAASEWQINLDSAELKLGGSEPRVLAIKFMVVEEDGEDMGLARLEAFELLAFGDRSVRPESGLWWAESGGLHATSGPGTGYSIEVQGQQMLMMANLYDEDGLPSWLFSSGALRDGVYRADLVNLYGGQSLFGDYAAPEAALASGRVWVHFSGPATATAWFAARDPDQPEAGLALRPVSLVRFAFSLGARSQFLRGRWVMVTEGLEQSTELELLSAPAKRGFQHGYTDATGDLRLDCVALSGRPQSPPAACTLQLVDGSPVAEIDAIGLNRMSGFSPTGDRVDLFRF